MAFWQIIVLAIIQGAAELLPVSSSAHVIAAAKLMAVKTDKSDFALMLIMLHTGTMFAVIVYFWKGWKQAFFSSRAAFTQFARRVIIATAVTGAIGFGLKVGIEKCLSHLPAYRGADAKHRKAEIEDLFGHLEVLAPALAAAGILILYAGLRSRNRAGRENITDADGVTIGAIQGLCLPFRGFSRSGATISLGLLRGMARRRAEEYSFALAVVLTPPLVAWEARRMVRDLPPGSTPLLHAFFPSLAGMAFSFFAGLIALKLLSRVLENGRWWAFGVYCLAAAGGVFAMYLCKL